MFLLLAAMEAGTGSAEPHPKPIDQGSWVMSADYPADALTLQQVGAVAYEVGVDAAGTVTDCTITASSGVKILDDKTCELVKARGHFSPEIAPDGKAVAGRYRSKLRWNLPTPAGGTVRQVIISNGADGYRCSIAYQNSDQPWANPRCEELGAALAREGHSFPATIPQSFSGPPVTPSPPPPVNWVSDGGYPADALRHHWEGVSRYLLDLDASGHVTKCTITASAGHKSLDDETCRIMTTRARFNPATDAGGVAIASHFANAIKWQIPDR